ncbi:M56 family metallopeptidase [Paenibacillus mendelii]|uniref:M56 family metallopeptidase n=1 Tax=Paenibacillus mendelii TaxID=206163 RepID=A0ABV6JM04_9BACL|nr:M56 family metallopeptidase [Paenibacillus mendelii]MCQ6560610.1 M56 family metallopeptidase [Paenibacillus mendelii]
MKNADQGAFVTDLINRYVIYIWLIGVLVSLTVHLSGYIRFSKVIKKTSKPGHRWENSLLRILADGRYRVRLVRNPYAATPMLVGILRPLIVIPDTNYSEVQLKHILLHELTHLKRYDIVIKWFSMIVTSLHWFNPLMYWMRREITRSSELSCDEAVIRKPLGGLTPVNMCLHQMASSMMWTRICND